MREALAIRRTMLPPGQPAVAEGVGLLEDREPGGRHTIVGHEVAFDEVRDRIAMDLAQQARATALHQYIRVLAGQAVVEGVELEAADSPLMQ